MTISDDDQHSDSSGQPASHHSGHPYANEASLREVETTLSREPSLLHLIRQCYRNNVRDPRRLHRANQILDNIGSSGQRLKSEELSALPDILYFGAQFRLASEHGIELPAYNISKGYFDNAQYPLSSVPPSRPTTDPARRWSLLGHQIGFPIGVSSSALTANSLWIYYFARHGFNVLTYKTVRSRFHPGFDKPNWIFASNIKDPLPVTSHFRSHHVTAEEDNWVTSPELVSTVNSFGVPSLDPKEWKPDVAEAKRIVEAFGQCLIVSVVGDIYDGDDRTRTTLVNDYVRVALHAEEAGADSIELNLSCPNSLDRTGKNVMQRPVCHNVDLTGEIIRSVRRQLQPGTRLIAKLSYLPKDLLETLVSAIGNYVDAIAGINTLQVDASNKDGENVFPGRPQAGLSGHGILNYALEFVRNLSVLKVTLGLEYEIIGMGGVTNAASFEALYSAGCNVVQTATGALANPGLAADCIQALGDQLPLTAGISNPEVTESVARSLLDAIEQGKGSTDKYALAAQMSVSPGLTYAVLEQLEGKGLVKQARSRRGHRFYEIPK
ncbi:hypothetical protein [Nocardia blacklockiae]|uniref:hypothetical protein n=1 Tax=Nocardia blacklockiae TaxID=480036 RepID=UPI0018956E57|nr:hypothetical protein [Nocardia blacklockiae]MBF6172104.1 hypothetical protein [Nocardia blacklockiae]